MSTSLGVLRYRLDYFIGVHSDLILQIFGNAENFSRWYWNQVQKELQFLPTILNHSGSLPKLSGQGNFRTLLGNDLSWVKWSSKSFLPCL